MDLSSATTTTFTSTDVNVTDTDHYITKTMADGSVQVFEDSQPMAAADSGSIGNADVLGVKTVGSGASLIVADSGVGSESGDYIDGRRVWLPWGGTNMDVSSMTESGKEIFERSIEWAGRQAGTGSASVGIVVSDKIELNKTAYIDSYDSQRGPYNATYNNADQAVVVSNNDGVDMVKLKDDSQIKGEVYVAFTADPDETITLETNALITGDISLQESLTGIPEVELPASIPASSGDIKLGPYNYPINHDYHFKKFERGKSSGLYISGDVTIVCDEKFFMDEYTRLIIYSGSSLTIYTPHFEANGYYTQANTSYGNPDQLKIYITGEIDGDKEFELEKGARVCATVYAPKGEMELEVYSEFYGSFLGRGLLIKDSSAFHQDIKEVEKPLPPLRYELTVVWEEGM